MSTLQQYNKRFEIRLNKLREIKKLTKNLLKAGIKNLRSETLQ